MKVHEVESNKNVVCPFCNAVIVDVVEIGPYESCPHTILVATDDGIEEADEKLIDLEALENKIEEEDLNYDEAISALEIPNTVLLKQYQPAPSFYGAYHLFKGE